MFEKNKRYLIFTLLCLILVIIVFALATCIFFKSSKAVNHEIGIINQKLQLIDKIEVISEKIDKLQESYYLDDVENIDDITFSSTSNGSVSVNEYNNYLKIEESLSELINYLRQEDAVFDIDTYKNLYNRVLNDESYDVHDDELQKEIERIYELNDLILQAVTINSNTESLKSDNFSNLADLLNVIGYLGTQERELRVDYKTGFSSMGYVLVNNFFDDVGKKIRILEKGFVERVDNEIPMPNISQYLIEDKIGRDSYQEELATYYSKLFELARSCPFEAPFFTKFVQDKQSAIETNVKTLNEHRLKNYQIKAFDAIKDVHEIDKKTSENDRKSRYVEMLKFDRSLLATELQILYENEVNSLKGNNQLFNEVLMVAVSSMHKIEDF